MEKIKLTIDNREVEVLKGTTILDAAKSMGIRIPTLCHMKLEDLEPYRVQYIAGILKLLEGVEIDYTEEGGTP